MTDQVDLKTIPVSPGGDDSSSTNNNENGVSTADMDEKLVTVFHDKDNFNVKHPLQNKWTLWFTKPSSGKVPYPLSHISFILVADVVLDRAITGMTC
jgi:translation initiation factor 4E